MGRTSLSHALLLMSYHGMCVQVPAVAAVLAVVYGIWNFLRSRQRVFLLDFACYKPPENLKVGLDDFMKGSKDSGVRTPSSLSHMQNPFVQYCN